jgi:DNA-binding response OmpR family regulator
MSPLSNGGGAALQTILIVEDNADVAQFISRQLEGRYTIHFAADGEQGIEQAQQLLPDLVITDVMMPHTDGYELCRTLRGNPLTSRIPIIIITAKTGEEDRIQGLQAGADAFLLKPFNAEELNVCIEKLLPPATLNVQSDKFAERVQEVILRLMPQGSLDVDSIAAELCLSPSQLRRKMNAATGMSPKKFIMKVRMDAAREMMSQNPDMKLSNIADKCGFYDLSHFIRLYKETYGITPSADHRTP